MRAIAVYGGCTWLAGCLTLTSTSVLPVPLCSLFFVLRSAGLLLHLLCLCVCTLICLSLRLDHEQLRDQAQLYESATSAKKAGKLVKLLIEVEKALNSAEAAEIAAQFDPAVTARYMNDAGLRFLPTPPPPPPPPRENVTDDKTNTTSTEEIREGTDIGVKKSTGTGVPNGGKGANGTKLPRRGASKNESEKGKRRPRSSKASPRKGSRSDRRSKGERVRDDGAGGQTLSGLGGEEDEDEVGAPLGEFIVGVAGCEVQCLLMVDEREGRLVVAVGDALTGEALMGSLIEEPEMVQLASHGLMRETAYVNRAAFQVRLFLECRRE